MAFLSHLIVAGIQTDTDKTGSRKFWNYFSNSRSHLAYQCNSNNADINSCVCVSQAPQQSGFVWQVTAPEETSALPSPWRPCPAASGFPTASWPLTPPPCSPPTPRPPAFSHSSTHCCLWEFSPSASTPMQVCVGHRGTSVGAFCFTPHLKQVCLPSWLEKKTNSQRDLYERRGKNEQPVLILNPESKQRRILFEH